MMKLKETKGRISILELVIILVIVLEVIFYVATSYGWLDFHMTSGNDGLYVNTAESTAKVNSMNGVQCPVNNCEKGGINCTHLTKDGYIGYFDSETNTIIGIKPKGYNGSTNPDVDGKTFTGAANTMVIQITCKDGNIDLKWVKGKE